MQEHIYAVKRRTLLSSTSFQRMSADPGTSGHETPPAQPPPPPSPPPPPPPPTSLPPPVWYSAPLNFGFQIPDAFRRASGRKTSILRSLAKARRLNHRRLLVRRSPTLLISLLIVTIVPSHARVYDTQSLDEEVFVEPTPVWTTRGGRPSYSLALGHHGAYGDRGEDEGHGPEDHWKGPHHRRPKRNLNLEDFLVWMPSGDGPTDDDSGEWYHHPRDTSWMRPAPPSISVTTTTVFLTTTVFTTLTKTSTYTYGVDPPLGDYPKNTGGGNQVSGVRDKGNRDKDSFGTRFRPSYPPVIQPTSSTITITSSEGGNYDITDLVRPSMEVPEPSMTFTRTSTPPDPILITSTPPPDQGYSGSPQEGKENTDGDVREPPEFKPVTEITEKRTSSSSSIITTTERTTEVLLIAPTSTQKATTSGNEGKDLDGGHEVPSSSPSPASPSGKDYEKTTSLPETPSSSSPKLVTTAGTSSPLKNNTLTPQPGNISDTLTQGTVPTIDIANTASAIDVSLPPSVTELSPSATLKGIDGGRDQGTYHPLFERNQTDGDGVVHEIELLDLTTPESNALFPRPSSEPTNFFPVPGLEPSSPSTEPGVAPGISTEGTQPPSSGTEKVPHATTASSEITSSILGPGVITTSYTPGTGILTTSLQPGTPMSPTPGTVTSVTRTPNITLPSTESGTPVPGTIASPGSVPDVSGSGLNSTLPTPGTVSPDPEPETVSSSKPRASSTPVAPGTKFSVSGSLNESSSGSSLTTPMSGIFSVTSSPATSDSVDTPAVPQPDPPPPSAPFPSTEATRDPPLGSPSLPTEEETGGIHRIPHEGSADVTTTKPSDWSEEGAGATTSPDWLGGGVATTVSRFPLTTSKSNNVHGPDHDDNNVLRVDNPADGVGTPGVNGTSGYGGDDVTRGIYDVTVTPTESDDDMISTHMVEVVDPTPIMSVIVTSPPTTSRVTPDTKVTPYATSFDDIAQANVTQYTSVTSITPDVTTPHTHATPIVSPATEVTLYVTPQTDVTPNITTHVTKVPSSVTPTVTPAVTRPTKLTPHTDTPVTTNVTRDTDVTTNVTRDTDVTTNVTRDTDVTTNVTRDTDVNIDVIDNVTRDTDVTTSDVTYSVTPTYMTDHTDASHSFTSHTEPAPTTYVTEELYTTVTDTDIPNVTSTVTVNVMDDMWGNATAGAPSQSPTEPTIESNITEIMPNITSVMPNVTDITLSVTDVTTGVTDVTTGVTDVTLVPSYTTELPTTSPDVTLTTDAGSLSDVTTFDVTHSVTSYINELPDVSRTPDSISNDVTTSYNEITATDVSRPDISTIDSSTEAIDVSTTTDINLLPDLDSSTGSGTSTEIPATDVTPLFDVTISTGNSTDDSSKKIDTTSTLLPSFSTDVYFPVEINTTASVSDPTDTSTSVMVSTVPIVSELDDADTTTEISVPGTEVSSGEPMTESGSELPVLSTISNEEEGSYGDQSPSKTTISTTQPEFITTQTEFTETQSSVIITQPGITTPQTELITEQAEVTSLHPEITATQKELTTSPEVITAPTVIELDSTMTPEVSTTESWFTLPPDGTTVQPDFVTIPPPVFTNTPPTTLSPTRIPTSPISIFPTLDPIESTPTPSITTTKTGYVTSVISTPITPYFPSQNTTDNTTLVPPWLPETTDDFPVEEESSTDQGPLGRPEEHHGPDESTKETQIELSTESSIGFNNLTTMEPSGQKNSSIESAYEGLGGNGSTDASIGLQGSSPGFDETSEESVSSNMTSEVPVGFDGPFGTESPFTSTVPSTKTSGPGTSVKPSGIDKSTTKPSGYQEPVTSSSGLDESTHIPVLSESPTTSTFTTISPTPTVVNQSDIWTSGDKNITLTLGSDWSLSEDKSSTPVSDLVSVTPKPSGDTTANDTEGSDKELEDPISTTMKVTSVPFLTSVSPSSPAPTAMSNVTSTLEILNASSVITNFSTPLLPTTSQTTEDHLQTLSSTTLPPNTTLGLSPFTVIPSSTSVHSEATTTPKPPGGSSTTTSTPQENVTTTTSAESPIKVVTKTVTSTVTTEITVTVLIPGPSTTPSYNASTSPSTPFESDLSHLTPSGSATTSTSTTMSPITTNTTVTPMTLPLTTTTLSGDFSPSTTYGPKTTTTEATTGSQAGSPSPSNNSTAPFNQSYWVRTIVKGPPDQSEDQKSFWSDMEARLTTAYKNAFTRSSAIENEAREKAEKLKEEEEELERRRKRSITRRKRQSSLWLRKSKEDENSDNVLLDRLRETVKKERKLPPARDRRTRMKSNLQDKLYLYKREAHSKRSGTTFVTPNKKNNNHGNNNNNVNKNLRRSKRNTDRKTTVSPNSVHHLYNLTNNTTPITTTTTTTTTTLTTTSTSPTPTIPTSTTTTTLMNEIITTNVPSEGSKNNVSRISEGNRLDTIDNNVNVRLLNITYKNGTRSEDEGAFDDEGLTELVYTVFDGDDPVLARHAVGNMSSLSDMEMAVYLDRVVTVKAEEYLKSAPDPDVTPAERLWVYWVIGGVVGLVTFIVFILWLACFIYKRGSPTQTESQTEAAPAASFSHLDMPDSKSLDSGDQLLFKGTYRPGMHVDGLTEDEQEDGEDEDSTGSEDFENEKASEGGYETTEEETSGAKSRRGTRPRGAPRKTRAGYHERAVDVPGDEIEERRRRARRKTRRVEDLSRSPIEGEEEPLYSSPTGSGHYEGPHQLAAQMTSPPLFEHSRVHLPPPPAQLTPRGLKEDPFIPGTSLPKFLPPPRLTVERIQRSAAAPLLGADDLIVPPIPPRNYGPEEVLTIEAEVRPQMKDAEVEAKLETEGRSSMTPKRQRRSSSHQSIEDAATKKGATTPGEEEQGTSDGGSGHNIGRLRKRFHDLLDDAFSLLHGQRPGDRVTPLATPTPGRRGHRSHSAALFRSHTVDASPLDPDHPDHAHIHQYPPGVRPWSAAEALHQQQQQQQQQLQEQPPLDLSNPLLGVAPLDEFSPPKSAWGDHRSRPYSASANVTRPGSGRSLTPVNQPPGSPAWRRSGSTPNFGTAGLAGASSEEPIDPETGLRESDPAIPLIRAIKEELKRFKSTVSTDSSNA
ncbi:uncharacterized protein LOC143025366 isoform X2 [Oratosquilla oratoria]|uniref:uncharacterized protein LOC143025366 isoform X2 n=1 Tax=Oratosquilla oratoria TaxID=337810 RepID=UPI003F7663FF